MLVQESRLETRHRAGVIVNCLYQGFEGMNLSQFTARAQVLNAPRQRYLEMNLRPLRPGSITLQLPSN